jgi:hypothetical protein
LQARPINFEEVAYDLVIDLEIGGSNHESAILRGLHLNEAEDFLHRTGDDTSLRVSRGILEALHGIGLTSTGLPICQDCRIVTFEYAPHSLFGRVFIYILLS